MRFSDNINYIALHAFSRNIDMLSPKLKKRDQKIERKISVFPVFLSGHFIPLVTKLGQSVLKHAEMQSKTRGVQNFGEAASLRRTSRKKFPTQQFDSKER